nr:biotin synthase BioB [Legionellales bacterium]
MSQSQIRHDWEFEQAHELYQLPLNDLLLQAQTVHRQHFKDANEVQMSTLLSIKTGACPEDCSYCGQSGHHKEVKFEKESLLSVETVVERAQAAKQKGATRFCMGAAWRSPPKKDLPKVIEMIKAVKALGLETCVTLGMLDETQADALQAAGLDYYNHNLDTSREFYGNIITTRTYQDRLTTLENLRNAGIKVCCGGILGLGESVTDRIQLLIQLANLPEHPQSVPINQLAQTPGTPLQDAPDMDEIEFVRIVALARIMLPKSMVRLSAGRSKMNDSMQALCFLAGANSIFLDDKLFLTANPAAADDKKLLHKLGLQPQTSEST